MSDVLFTLPSVRARWPGLRWLNRDNEAWAQRSAVVFAPHPDDEVLGCGGTIALKRNAGAPVDIVFMTDGSGSHGHLMHHRDLVQLRKEEAIAAGGVLGVAASHLHFLGFRDGALNASEAAAIARVRALLDKRQPSEVYLPYAGDEHPDHVAAHRIVRAALEQPGGEVDAYEYPVWYWSQWPWTSLPVTPGKDTLHALRQSVRAGFGLQAVRAFRWAVDVTTVEATKREALRCHRSQMERLQSNQAWGTLQDISEGEFLDCFFQGREIFKHDRFPRRAGAT